MRAAIVLSALLAASVAAHAHAQVSAARIAQQAAERWEQRLRNVHDVTVVQQAVGTDLVIYSERAAGSPSGWRVRSFVRGADGRLRPGNAAATLPFAAELVHVFRDNASRFRLEGTQAVDGKQAYVLALEGQGAAADLVPGMPLGGGPAELRGARVRYFLDTAELVPLRTELTLGTSRSAPGLKVVFTFGDYRPVGGLLVPYRISMAPDADSGSGSITVTVQDVKVNAGPPAGAPPAH
jgi:hypothetical protein